MNYQEFKSCYYRQKKLVPSYRMEQKCGDLAESQILEVIYKYQWSLEDLPLIKEF